MNSIYLAGPITAPDDNGAPWRNNLIEDYRGEVEFLNPLDEFDPQRTTVLPRSYKYRSDKPRVVTDTDVVESNLQQLRAADGIYVGGWDPETPSPGTAMELAYNKLSPISVPVTLVTERKVTDWAPHVRKHVDVFSRSPADAIRFLK